MKKIFTLLVFMLAVVSVQAKKDRLYASFGTLSNANIANNVLSFTATSNSYIQVFTFTSGELADYTALHIKVTPKTTTSGSGAQYRIQYVNSDGTKTVTSDAINKTQTDELVITLSTVSANLSTMTAIRLFGPSGHTSTMEISAKDVFLEKNEEVECMSISTTINNSTTKSDPFAWEGNPTFNNNFGNSIESNGTALLGSPNANGSSEYGFYVTGYDYALADLKAYTGGTIRYMNSGTINEYTTYAPIGSITKITSVKGGSNNASKAITVNSIDFIKEFKATSTTAFSIAASAKSTVAYDRSFTAGTKSTVCLPFDLTQEEADAAGTFYEMTAGDASGITFTKVTTGGTTAYKPYIFEAKADGTPFSNITNKEVKASAGATTSDNVSGYTFHGTLAKQDVASGAYGYSAGAFKKAGTGVTIKAFRGYITYEGPGSAPALLNINFGDGSETTGISDATRLNNNEEIRNNDAVYNLQGQRVSANHKGIVIKNGKKYFVK